MNAQNPSDPQAAPQGVPHGHPAPQVVYVQAPPEKRRSWFRRHKFLTGLGVVVVLIVLVQAANGGDGGTAPAGTAAGTTPTSTDEKPADEEKPSAPGIGDAARDGKFEFVVVSVEDGGTTLGPDGFEEKAQGRFLLVRVDVTNIGDEPQHFFGNNQTLRDAEGRKHAVDTTAAIWLDDSSSFIEEINPGNTIEGTLVFDLPKSAEPASLELHDSAFSGGVTVEIG